MRGEAVDREKPLYWHFNAARGEPKVAMRDGDWKVLARLTGPVTVQGGGIRAEDQKALKTAELTGFELYNLRNDIGEKRDLAAKEPERLKAIRAKLEAMYHEVREESPTWPEWEFARYESGRIEWPSYRK